MNIVNGVKPAEPLAQRVIKSGFWVFALKFVQEILYFARLIILARLLAPRDFGVIGIAMLTLAVLDTFSQTGIHDALIQKKEDIRDYLDAAWTGLVLRGLALFALMFLLAPAAASFFKAPEATAIIRVFGLSQFVAAFANIGVIEFEKHLKFHKQFVYHIAGNITNFVFVVVWALLFRSVWAFVLADLAGRIIQVVVSYAIHPYRPRFRWDLPKIKELFRFGRWVMGSSVLIFLVTQGDDIFVGKVLGAAMLGFYQMAFKLSNTPTTEISHVIGQVMFPTYAKLQDNPLRLKEAYLKVFQVIMFLSFALTALILVLGPDFIRVFLGQKWLPMVASLQILALAGLARSIVGTTGPLFYGVGRPEIEVRWEFVRLAVLAASLFPLTLKWELAGASLAVFLSLFVSLIGFMGNALRILSCSRTEYARYFLPPTLSAAALVTTAWGVMHLAGHGLFGMILSGLFGMIVYVGLTLVLERKLEYRILFFVKDRVWPLVRKQKSKMKKMFVRCQETKISY